VHFHTRRSIIPFKSGGTAMPRMHMSRQFFANPAFCQNSVNLGPQSNGTPHHGNAVAGRFANRSNGMKFCETRPLIAAILLGLGLAGCTGSGGAGPEIGPAAGQIDEPGRDALNAEYAALDRQFFMYKPLEGHALRTSGSATFNGVAALRPEGGFEGDGRAPVTGNPDLIADMAVTVDFGSDAVTASMWDFYDRSGARAGGSVHLAGTQDGGRLNTSGSGLLDWGDRNETLDVTMDGYILADEAGMRGTLDVISTVGLTQTTLEGRAVLVNDGRPTR